MEASKRPAEENGSNGNGTTEAKKAKLDEDCGALLFCGTTEWHNALKPGKLKEDSYHSKNNIHEPMRIAAIKDKRFRHLGSGQDAAHVVVVDEAGQAWSWGNNEFGQLGQGDNLHRRIPTPIAGTGPGGHTIVSVSLGNRHTLLLTSMGSVLACGDNSDGQCAQGEMKTKTTKSTKGAEEIESCTIQTIKTPSLINHSGPPVIKVSAGKEFSLMLDVEGCVWSFGCQEFGVLGNGTDGSYNSSNAKVRMKYAGLSEPFKITRVYERDPKTKKTKLMQMMRIKDISAGSQHAAMVDELGKAFSWGAGAYGRTGLGEPTDSHTPTWISSLDHPKGKIEKVMCGMFLTILIGKTPGSIFMAGAVDSGKKECNMTPKNWFELGDVSQDGQTVAFWRKGFSSVGEDGKVTYSNHGPCYGELGNTERYRTQGVPKKSKELDYVHVMQVGTGINHAVYIVRDTEEEDEEEIEEYELLDQQKIEYTEADMKKE